MRGKYVVYNIMLVFITFLLISGCDDTVTDGQQDTENRKGQIKIIHAASSTGKLDIAFKDVYDNNFYALEYGISYGYQYGYYDFITGLRELRCYIPYTSIVVAGAFFTVEENLRYTILAYDYEATINPDLMILANASAAPDSGFAFIRFINVSTDAPALVIFEQASNTVLDPLDRLAHSDYLEFAAGTYRFQIRDSGTDVPLLDMSPETFLSGHAYIIVFSGSVSDLTSVPFNARVFPETSIEETGS